MRIRRQHSQRGVGRGLVPALVLGLVLALALAGCGGGAEEPGPSAVQDPGLLHVHGLGVDPGDTERILVATHTGLFAVRDGVVSRVGEAMHDLMGFTVADDGTFLASGHPDLRDESLLVEDAPALLGLVRSTDGGHTWESLSLLGQADFHALDAAHGRVYGGDTTGGRFMVSADGLEWETRSTGVLFHSLAVSPDDPERMVATGPDGLARSTDGGRNWEILDGFAPLVVDWGAEALYGADPDGQVAVSRDGGSSWETLGSLPGAPAALHAAAGRLLAATPEGSVLASPDGVEWSELVAGSGHRG